MSGWLMVALVAMTGCGAKARAPLAKVHGKVTLNGKPLPSGRVLFLPATDPANGEMVRPASGEIQTDGAYTLTTETPNDGAEVGEHKVAVIANETTPKGPGKSLVPTQYVEPSTSPLRKTVVAGDNRIDLDLKN